MTRKKIYVIAIFLTVIACAFAIASDYYAKKGAAEAAKQAQAQKREQEEALKNVILELSYKADGKNTSTETVIRFYKDGTMSCTGLTSSMYVIDYKTSYHAQDQLVIDPVSGYKAKAVDEAEVLGLPDELPINIITHVTEQKENGGITLNILGDMGDDSGTTIFGVFDLSPEQLSQLGAAL